MKLNARIANSSRIKGKAYETDRFEQRKVFSVDSNQFCATTQNLLSFSQNDAQSKIRTTTSTEKVFPLNFFSSKKVRLRKAI